MMENHTCISRPPIESCPSGILLTPNPRWTAASPTSRLDYAYILTYAPGACLCLSCVGAGWFSRLELGETHEYWINIFVGSSG
jgi:hypothetical protein